MFSVRQTIKRSSAKRTGDLNKNISRYFGRITIEGEPMERLVARGIVEGRRQKRRSVRCYVLNKSDHWAVKASQVQNKDTLSLCWNHHPDG